MVELKEQDFESFFAVPSAVYGADTLFVSQLKGDLRKMLDWRQQPTFSSDQDLTYFTAFHEGRPSGRIVAHVHRASNELHHSKRCYFGYFDCADHEPTAAALLGAAEAFARRQGCDEIVGNFNLTAMQVIGVVTDGFDKAPYVDQIYGPPHLPALLKSQGYTATFPMSTFEFDLQRGSDEGVRGAKQDALTNNPDYTLRSLRRWGLSKDLEHCRHLLNAAFANNPMFVPQSEAEFAAAADGLTLVMDPRLTSMVSYRGQPVGVLICIPDLNPLLKAIDSTLTWRAILPFLRHRRRRDRAVIVYYAVHPDHHNAGINGLLIQHLFHQATKAGYATIGGTWISDDNLPSIRQTQKMGAATLHRLHLFAKPLGSATE